MKMSGIYEQINSIKILNDKTRVSFAVNVDAISVEYNKHYGCSFLFFSLSFFLSWLVCQNTERDFHIFDEYISIKMASSKRLCFKLSSSNK